MGGSLHGNRGGALLTVPGAAPVPRRGAARVAPHQGRHGRGGMRQQLESHGVVTKLVRGP